MALLDLDLHPRPKVLRAFGCGALLSLGILGVLGWTLWQWSAAVCLLLLALALFSGLASLGRPAWNRPLYLVLTVAAFPIGLVVSYVVLALIFFLLLTPVGLLFRLLGRDALRRKRPPDATTYWIDRSAMPEPERYFRQF